MVGAGIVGASTAFHLSDRGVDVVVVDGSRRGAATPAGAGIICPWPTARPDDDYVAQYVAGAHGIGPIVERLTELGETATSFRRVGSVVLAETPDDLAEIEARVARRAGGDPIVGDVHRITGSDAREMFPPLRDDLPGIFIAGGARLDGRLFTAALLRARGLVPVTGDAELVVDGDRVRGVVVGSETLSADAVVVAGGAWTSRLLEPFGVPVDVEPQKGQILHLRSPALARIRPTGTWPSVLPPGPHYLRAFDDDRFVVGASRETGSGYDVRPTVVGQREVLDAATAWAPGLADAEVIEFRVGLRPFAPNANPMVGAVDGIGGLHVGTGMGPGGLTMGPHAGRRLADAIIAG